MSFQAEFTGSGRLVLFEAEALIREEVGIEVFFKSGISSESEEFAAKATVFLTDFRIVFAEGRKSATLPLHYVGNTSTRGGMFRSLKVFIETKSVSTLPQYLLSLNPGTPSPSLPALPRSYLLKFKSGDRDAFFSQLNSALAVKAWDRVVTLAKPKVAGFGISTFHIGGIQKSMETESKQAKETIGTAFSDMATLREKARDLNALAQQLKGYEEETKDEELKEIRGVMNSLGFTTGVSEESAGRNFIQQLAREIADFAYPYVENAGGLISLYDVYCLYNRSRPSDMISPSDMLSACTQMKSLQLPLVYHEFPSGIKALQIRLKTEVQMLDRVLILMRENTHVSVLKLSGLMNVSPIVAKQYLLMGEERGLFCRDESVEGLHFYENRFRQTKPVV